MLTSPLCAAQDIGSGLIPSSELTARLAIPEIRDFSRDSRFTRGKIESNAPSELTRAERIGYEVRPLARSERNSFISRKVERVKMAVSCGELGGFKSTIPRGINGGERILRYIRRETVPRRVRGTLAHGKCGK